MHTQANMLERRGGDGEVEDWPLLSAVKARGKKKCGGERKKGNHSHTGYASRLNCICAPTVGEQEQHGEALHPPSCQPHLSAVIGDWYRGAPAQDGFTSESRERVGEPGCRAPQLGCSTHPAQVSLLHRSLPGCPASLTAWHVPGVSY